MRSISIKSRLVATLAILCVMVVVIGGLGLNGLRQTVRGLETVYNDRVVPLEQIKVISDAYAVNVVDTAHEVRNGNLAFAKGVENIDAARRLIKDKWSAYLATFLVDKEKELVRKIEPAMARADAAIAELRGLMAKEEAPALAEFTVKKMYPAINPVSELMDKLAEVQLEVAKEEFRNGESLYRNLVATTIAVTVAVVLLAAVLGVLLIRATVLPLERALTAVGAVAEGNLAVRIEAGSEDEIGRLLQGLERMRVGLSEAVFGIRNAAESVGLSSAEIARGNQDLSNRTQEQASSLEETSSSMEELTSTVKQNASNAAQANQLAAGASEVATRGGEAVRGVVDTMSGITDSSKRIADIIGVIDGIAFQTNILALNAAVEAARAGEQGRGFAVVASEVRSLAQRSAQAAKEIKGLIQESVGRVEAGTRQVEAAGKTMDELLAAVKRVTDIMGEIAAASEEQLSGIEQVGGAVTQMDQVVQQNAALVEESSAAAENLASQAQALVETVARFKLEQGAGYGLREAPRAAVSHAPTPRSLAAKPHAGALGHAPARRRAPAALQHGGEGYKLAAASHAKADDEGEWKEI